MKFLTDQDVYAATGRHLAALGHDVVTVAQLGLAQEQDSELLTVAHQDQRVFVTRDRDFGSLVFVQDQGGGVIYLRMMPSTQIAVHAELERILTLYDEATLLQSFVVVGPGRHRLRKLT